MVKQTNIAQSLMNIAIDPSGVVLKDLPIPITQHFSTMERLTYYSEHVRKIQIERAKQLHNNN